MIIHDNKGNAITEFEQLESGNYALSIAFPSDGKQVHLDAENVAANNSFMLIDLSDTTNWKHTATDHLHIRWIAANFNPSTTFRGDVELGFLANVTTASGDFHAIKTWHFDQQANALQAFLQFNHTFHTTLDDCFGPVTYADPKFQTDTNLIGPDGNQNYPSGNGDLVLRVWRTAGNIDVGMTIGYYAD